MKVTNNKDIEDRVIQEAETFLEEGATIRTVAESVHMSKSAVAFDLKHRLKQCGRPDLYDSVIKKLNYNRIDAPFRGGKSAHINSERRRKS